MDSAATAAIGAADALLRASRVYTQSSRGAASAALRACAEIDPQLARVYQRDAERVATLDSFELEDLAHDYLALSLSDRARSDAECRALGLD